MIDENGKIGEIEVSKGREIGFQLAWDKGGIVSSARETLLNEVYKTLMREKYFIRRQTKPTSIRAGVGKCENRNLSKQ